MTKKQYVMIKGTKDGLVLKLDDKCAYSDLLEELRNRVSESELEGLSQVQVDLGYRYCNESELKELTAIIHSSPNLHISKIQSDVLTVEECNERVLEKQSETYIGIVRSGQVLEAKGDLVVIGDVNPNARVIAGGSIYVLGRLKGIAHAGANGNREAVIAASWLEATHLIIDDKMELMTDELTILSEQPEMECAYLHTKGFIAIDRLQELRIIRPQLSSFRGGFNVGEAIVITSGKGGVGKTTTTANLGTALALQGKKVCLVDTDLGLRNLDVILGLENRIIYDLVDVIEGRCKTHQALVKDKRFEEGLFLLPAAQTTDKNSVTPDQMKKLVEELKRDYDYILIDCPAGIEQGYKNAVAGADRAIVVTTPEISAIRDADRIIGMLEQEEIEPPKLIINRIKSNLMNDAEALDVNEITTHLSIDLLGIVMDDERVITSSNKGEPIVMNPANAASLGYRNIARRILGESVPLMSISQTKSGFFGKLKSLFAK